MSFLIFIVFTLWSFFGIFAFIGLVNDFSSKRCIKIGLLCGPIATLILICAFVIEFFEKINKKETEKFLNRNQELELITREIYEQVKFGSDPNLHVEPWIPDELYFRLRKLVEKR